MKRPVLAVLLVGLAVGCGGRQNGTKPESGTATADAGATDPAPDTGVASVDAGPAAPNAPSAAECEAMVDHVIELAAKGRPADDPSTPEDKAKTRDKLMPTLGAECRKLSRATYDCVMKAPDVASYLKCQPK